MMKKMMFTMLGIVSLMACSFSSLAQTYREKKIQFVAKMQQQLKDSLGLNDEQIKKVKDINDKYQTQFAEIAQNSSMEKDEKRKENQKVYQQKRAELKQVISVDQITRMEKMEKRIKEEIGF